ncbi:AraC family transcriptional regulator [Paenibacillaceae bacterium]|nr:AraC family transcriptional regulator [Paenibacillaceae bacterium]
MTKNFTYTVVSNPISIEHGSLNVLFTGESQTLPGHRLGPKVYDFYLMHHIISGRGTFTCKDEQHELGPGQIFMIEPEQLVSYVSDAHDPWQYRWIAFAGVEADAIIRTAGFLPDQPVHSRADDRRIAVLFNLIRRAFRESGRAAHLQAAGYLQLLMAALADNAPHETGKAFVRHDEGEQLMQQMLHYLSTQYAEPVSIERMADTLGYSRAYLSRLFKRSSGLTPVTFLLHYRLDKARQLLRGRQELTIEQVAASAGFQDPLYFSKQFRRIHGQSPSAYREAMRNL